MEHNRLAFEILLQALVPLFPPQAAFLVAAKGNFMGVARGVVDPHQAVFQRFREAEDPRVVLRIDIAGQTKGRGIGACDELGFCAEGEHRGHRAKDLLLTHRHVVADVEEHGGRIKPPVRQLPFRVSYCLGHSLRDLQETLALTLGEVLSLSACNRIVSRVTAQLAVFKTQALASPPPILLVDGMWVKIAYPTGEYRHDAQGRRAPSSASRSGWY